MKRYLLSILMVVIGLSAFSQSPSRLISLQPSYPISIGGSTADGITLESNLLSVGDIELDSLPQYEIRYIDTQTVRYSEEGYGFYVKADSLHSPNVVYSCEVNDPPQGEIKFNETTGRFKYYPAADDYTRFVVIFTATNGTESISEDVEFCPMPRTVSEAEIFCSKGTMPDAGDYITIAETPKSEPMFLNNLERTVYSVSISGKDVIFDNAIQNKVKLLNGRTDIYELNIYAERLIIRSALHFPQTNITIYAKEVFFEDNGIKISSINTTPLTEEKRVDGIGANGANAGNISIFMKEFKSDVAIRFILNGAPGQSTNRNGSPGNGGNGGTLTSTIDVSSYCDLARGSGGVKYDVGSDDSSIYGPAIDYGSNGKDGILLNVSSSNTFLHPFYIAAVIRHANDAFINNYTEYALQTCREYRSLINEYINTSSNDDGGHDEGSHDWGDILGRRRSNIANNETEMEIPAGLDWGEEMISSDEGIEKKFELQNELLEIEKMLFKLEQGLDYFGNPAGWVPLLSFEVYLQNYNNEIDRAIPTLYLYYWMNRIDRTLQEKVRACQEAAIQTEQEIDSNTELLKKLVGEVPKLQGEAENMNRMITELTQRIDALQNQLMAQAEKSVKKKHKLLGLFSIGKTIANVISFFGPWGTAIGGTISAGLSIATNNIDISTGSDYSSALKDIGNTKVDTITLIKDKNGKVDGLASYNSIITKSIDPLITNINNLAKVLSKNASNSEIAAEYNRLIANSPEWNRMKAEFDELNVKKDELVKHINQVFIDMSTITSELSNDFLALDAFRRDAFIGNSKRDLNAMLYLDKMEQRAKGRLLLYDYYLRKAYEYRLLEPYAGEEYNLNGMFDRLETLGMALDSVVNVPAYNTLGSIYRDRVSDMTHRIIEKYTYEQSERSTNVPITISREQLDAINANGSVTLNLYEIDNGSYFFQDEENIRIVNIGVKYIKAHAVGSASRSRLALDLKHSGISQYRKNGQIYWFDHMSRNNDNPHLWRTTIDFNDVADVAYPETHQNSVAISSLLSSILSYNVESVMLFSRPSVWSDITMSKQVQTKGNDILIDSLVLELQYDYTLRPDNIRNIDVTANNGLMPYIACSAEDISGRSSGNGPLYRSYRTSSQPVSFTAMDRYESYYFKNWTDQVGSVVSEEPVLTVNRQKDQYYIANYERRVPILNVPDTVTIKEFNESNEYVVYVGNIGSGDIKMDWYVSDSLSTCVYLNGVAEGIDDGYFTFSFDSVPDELDSLKIFAPETDEMSKMIYIAVDDEVKQAIIDKIESAEGSKDQLRIYPNPMQEFVKIEGEGLKSVSIFSITGKEMYRRNIGGKKSETINVSGLPNGVYIVSVNTRDGMISKKLLKTN